jgi:septin family protein
MRRKSGLDNVTFTLEESKGPPHEVKSAKSSVEEGVRLSEQEKEYLLPHFTMLVVGKPGSGKTTVIRNLMTSKMFYKKKFDHVLIVSPSANKMEIPVPKENMR